MRKMRGRTVFAPLVLSMLTIAGCGGGSSNSRTPAVVTTLAGSSTAGLTDGIGTQALFDNPKDVAVDTQGNVYVSDYNNNRIRRITPAGIVSTLTNEMSFSRPFGLTFGPDGTLYVETDSNGQGQRDNTTGTIWRIQLANGIASLLLPNLGRPRGLTALPDGRLALSDPIHDTISLYNPGSTTVSLLAGTQDSPGFADGLGTVARFNTPYGATTAPGGNILVADCANNRIRLISPTGVVATYAGNGTAGYRDGSATQAEFNAPQAVSADGNGNVYVSDVGNHRIRRIDASGNVSTLAGDGTAGYKDGQDLNTEFYGQQGLAVSPDGTTLYVADGGGETDQPYNRIRKIVLPH